MEGEHTCKIPHHVHQDESGGAYKCFRGPNFSIVLVNGEVFSMPVNLKTALKDNYNVGEAHPKAETPSRNEQSMMGLPGNTE